jgi:hypothetical protein
MCRYRIPNLMVNSNLFTEFSLLFAFKYIQILVISTSEILANTKKHKKAHQPEIEIGKSKRTLF